MKKVELLSPVGNMETLAFAIHNGCDAVYFAGKKFGARKFANNFDYDEIVEAIKYCHLYDVKAYITVNTLMFDNELDEVLEYIDFLHKSNVDAIIMQDIGLIKKVHETFPNLEIHISTQSHNHNDEGIKFFENLGASRIVLDREMSLDEIKRLNTNLEKEVFIHGALCVSYSGCCLFSSMNGGRSGNRGECVASCRLKYELYKNGEKIKTNGEYLLSTKELNTLNRVKDLIEAGIDSFKIEGRMKSPEYVGFVTRLYRMMIDKYYNNEDTTLKEEDLYNLKKLYNREFTEGYLFNNSGKKLMNIKTPNHLGVELGQVIEYNKKYITIKLNDDVKQEDGIRLPNNEGMILNRIYNKKLLLVNKLQKGDILIIDNKVNLQTKGTVLKTIDKNLMDELKKYNEKKIPVDIKVECKLNKPIKMMITNNKETTVLKEYSNVEKATSSPTSIETIIKQVSKLGNTPLVVNNVTVESDNDIFVSIKELNELRRMLVDEFVNIKKTKKKDYVKKDIKTKEIILKQQQPKINALVRNEEQLKVCLDNNINNIYTEDKELYEKYKDKGNIYLKLPRVMLKHPEYINENLLITEIGALEKYKDNNNIIADYTINITNNETSSLLNEYNTKLVTLSPELTKDRLNNVVPNNNLEYIVYGTIELMIMKYCPLKMLVNNDNEKCNLCTKGDKYYLKDQNDNYYRILNTKHYTHIMHKEPLDNIDNIKLCLDKNITEFRIELLDETKTEIEYIIKKIRKELGE